MRLWKRSRLRFAARSAGFPHSSIPPFYQTILRVGIRRRALLTIGLSCLGGLVGCEQQDVEETDAKVAKSELVQRVGPGAGYGNGRAGGTRDALSEGMIKRAWKVPADFVGLLQHRIDQGQPPELFEEDPFTGEPGWGWTRCVLIGGEQRRLESLDIEFPPGAASHFDPWKGMLTVINTEENIALIDSLIASMKPMEMFVLDAELFYPLERKRPGQLMAEEIARARVERKLREIIIPVVDFNDPTVAEVIEFLERSSREFDTLAGKGESRGIAITVETMGEVGSARDSKEKLAGLDFLKARVEGMNLRDVSVAEVLQYLCGRSRVFYHVDHRGVMLYVLGSDSRETMVERRWHIDPLVMARLRTDLAGPVEGEELDPFGGAEPDPFGGDTALSGGDGLEGPEVQSERPLKELLREVGVDFSTGSSIEYDAEGMLLVVRNSLGNQDLMEILLEMSFVDLSLERAFEEREGED